MSWIDIDIRPPKLCKPVLVYTESEIKAVAFMFKKKTKKRAENKFMTMIGGGSSERIITDVIYWDYLPKDPPKKK